MHHFVMPRVASALLCLLLGGGSLIGLSPSAAVPPAPQALQITDAAVPLAQPDAVLQTLAVLDAKTDGGLFKPAEYAGSAFHSDKAEGPGDARIDLSAVADGYVAVSARSDKRLKFQVINGSSTYNYDIYNDGTPSVFPLQTGNGSYTFRVIKNVTGTKYSVVHTIKRDVRLNDEFQPYLRPSAYVNYNESSDCVKKASELAKDAKGTLGFVTEVFKYVTSNISYDREKAASVKSGYLPTPDKTMSSGKGICFDYAALAAAMLRSQGVPTKVIFGYVAPNDTYHAWNVFYTTETGWVAVEYKISSKSWNRLDLTFAAGGASASFVGDGSKYSDLYQY